MIFRSNCSIYPLHYWPKPAVILLQNDMMRVEVLHPVGEEILLGPRFCTGGYIHQVSDSVRGPLLSGPEYPARAPSVVNGQGAPEVFQNTLFTDEEEIPERKMIIGVGSVANTDRRSQRETHFGSTVERYCEWKVGSSPLEVAMETEQESNTWALSLTRTVSLTGRSVRSGTSLRNRGKGPLPFRWFAHPFFPLPADLVCLKCEPVPKVFSSEGFSIDQHGEIRMKRAYDWRKGCFQWIEGLEGVSLAATQVHPLVGAVSVLCDFPLVKLAVWANDRTFSMEPFFSRTLEPGEEVRWSVTYTFGHPHL